MGANCGALQLGPLPRKCLVWTPIIPSRSRNCTRTCHGCLSVCVWLAVVALVSRLSSSLSPRSTLSLPDPAPNSTSFSLPIPVSQTRRTHSFSPFSLRVRVFEES